jgi:hypothetical protein
MSSIAFWIGVVIFGLGAIFGLLSAVRTLQISRRWSDYRLRQRYVVQARGSVLLALLSGTLALALLVLARSTRPSSPPAPVPITATNTTEPTASPISQEPPTGTATTADIILTATPITPSPVVIPTTVQATATPAMPIAVQALIQGTVTPAFDVEFGRLRFSTEINNYTLVAPGEVFTNPIKQMYSVFTYQPVGVKVEWIALWYQNGALMYVDTTSWKDFPAGVGVASWIRPAPEWQPGDYEVQVFLGTDWKASGRFALAGNPPTVTPSPLPSATVTPAPTSTASSTPTITRTPTASPLPPPSRTPSATQTATARPSATASPSETPTNTAAARAAPSSTQTASLTAAPSSTWTPRPSATPIPSSTATRTPSRTPSVTPPPTLTPTLMPVTLEIYFTNTRPSGGTSPVVAAVGRQIAGTNDAMAAALDQYFAGPTVEEQNRGLELTRNGFAGYRRVQFANGVVSVYLSGNCAPSGTGYSLARPLIATLRQFPGVLYVKLYDAYDHTGNALSAADSWPTCLDVIFTLTPTASPTSVPTLTPSRTPTATTIPTHTALPSPTATPPPTRTPPPTSTSSPLPTRTALPAATRTAVPSATNSPLPTATSTRTPLPSATFTRTPSRTPTSSATATATRTPLPSSTPRPTLTPSITFTPGPTWTPRPTLTLTPINAPTKVQPSASQAAVPAGPTPTLDTACDHAEFLGDVTIVDNATLRPGEPFRKTWRIQNAGNCPWTAAYRLVFVRGDQMGAPDSVPLPPLVASGQSADISVDLIAPAAQGEYGGFWQLQTPGGTTFGMGPAASGNLWVQIRVAGDPIASATATRTSAATSGFTPTGWAEATLTAFVATQTAEAAPTATARAVVNTIEVVNLAESACSAQWQANDGILSCPGADGDPRGLVAVLGQADLEDGTKLSAPTLLTVPPDAQDGYILGLYPQYLVQPGDRFTAGVGCEIGAQLCSVLFRVSYLDTMGAAHDLWTVGEFLDGHHVDLDLDLSELAGQQIRIVLSVGNLGSSTGDRALWVAPRIVNTAGGDQAAPATVRPTNTVRAATTPVASPTPQTPPSSPTVAAPTATPTAKPPIPQFFDLAVEFFRQLFGQR